METAAGGRSSDTPSLLVAAINAARSGEADWSAALPHVSAEACHTASESGKLPLHQALEAGATEEVVLRIQGAHPEGCAIKDAHGNHPVHLAARHGASPAVIRGVLDADPQGCREQDREGRLALHLAAAKQAPAEVLRELLRADKATAAAKDNDGYLPLHWLFNKQWLDDLHVDLSDGVDVQCTPPDVAEAAELLLVAYPEGARAKNKWNELPLHVAVHNPFTTLAQVQRLVDLYPEGLCVSNTYGEVPLAVAAQAWAPHLARKMGAQAAGAARTCGEVVKLLINQNLDAAAVVRTVGSEGSYLPLDLAVGNQAPVEVVQCILSAYPAAVRGLKRELKLPVPYSRAWPHESPVRWDRKQPIETTNSSVTPLETAVRTSASTAVLQLLLQHFPAAMSNKTRRGDYPLDLAVQNNDSANLEDNTEGTMVKRLLTAYASYLSTESIADSDLVVQLMHLAVSCDAPCKEPLAVVEHITRVYPRSIDAQNRDGDVPLHVAVRKTRSHSPRDDVEVVLRMKKKKRCDFQAGSRNHYKDMPLHAALTGSIITAHFTDSSAKLGIVFGDRFPFVKRLEDKDGDEYPANAIDGLQADCRLVSINGETLTPEFTFKQAKPKVKDRPLTLVFIAPRKSPPSAEVIRHLLDEFPSAARETGSHGLLPIHLALQTCDLSTVDDDSVEILKALVDPKYHPGDPTWWMESLDNEGRSALVVAAASGSRAVREWARKFKAFLERYRFDDGPAIHLSRGCKAVFAADLSGTPAELVVLKMMKNREQFEREIEARRRNGHDLDRSVVIGVLRWHTPAAEPYVVEGWQSQEKQNTDSGDEYPYVLVLERGERSLHDACAKERIAGYELAAIKHVMKCVTVCVQKLHHAGLIHADLKQRNVLRKVMMEDDTDPWILCDMDASSLIGQSVGFKTSSAYAPPELAAAKYAGQSENVLDAAAPSFDVWSLGVILFELCTGHTLFAQDTNNDELVNLDDRTRLCSWLCISDEELEPVLKSSEVKFGAEDRNQTIAAAKDLIRWCLHGNPSARPTIDEFLAHRFLATDPAKKLTQCHVRPMQYYAFMSHAQADASGTVGTLFYAYAQLGLHNWIDMRQKLLTLAGMKQGVRDSAVFLLVLSEHVLGSWFCQQELLCAIEEEKPIQLVVEVDKRFNAFDQTAWDAFNVAVDAGAEAAFEVTLEQIGSTTVERRICRAPESPFDKLPCAIRDAINKSLPNAVIYRRRDFEQEAMLRALCARNDVVLPSNLGSEFVAPSTSCPAITVFVICNPITAKTMLADLTEALEAETSGRLTVTRNAAELETADKVLLLLSADVLTPPALDQLEEALRVDKEKNKDRVCAVFDEDAGWRFGCPEQKSASAAVQNCLTAHEALAYRPRDRSNRLPNRHEFPAMARNLLQNLGAGTAQDSDAITDGSEWMEPVDSPPDRRGVTGGSMAGTGTPTAEVLPQADEDQKHQLEMLQQSLAERDVVMAKQEAALAEKAAELRVAELSSSAVAMRARLRVLERSEPAEGLPPAGA